MGIILKDFQDKLASRIKMFSNGGYSNTQLAQRRVVSDNILAHAKKTFPEIADFLEIKYFSGCGYFSGYSDFMITYKNWPIIAISTHTNTIENKRYVPEYYIKYSDRICEAANVGDISDLEHAYTIDMIADECMKYSRESKRAAVEFEIKKKERELEKLKSQLASIG
ncbi:hypothetical protein [Butyrivibrio sp.]|uniref:hypothetical protein n=1 Tax=Butyrivibrio sp. TaxID=28121 RepID=UPI0025BA70A0|nr:hypothetical protein [Butyrivibrio sp.]MBQ7431257.1 hypothetical protein [Butyrivibrio sp.]MBQ9303472.1 hypothetical protein [Butyrivibrio sp.]